MPRRYNNVFRCKYSQLAIMCQKVPLIAVKTEMWVHITEHIIIGDDLCLMTYCLMLPLRIRRTLCVLSSKHQSCRLYSRYCFLRFSRLICSYVTCPYCLWIFQCHGDASFHVDFVTSAEYHEDFLSTVTSKGISCISLG